VENSFLLDFPYGHHSCAVVGLMPTNIMEINSILERREPHITNNSERHLWKY